jgi:hypothetical protein
VVGLSCRLLLLRLSLLLRLLSGRFLLLFTGKLLRAWLSFNVKHAANAHGTAWRR